MFDLSDDNLTRIKRDTPVDRLPTSEAAESTAQKEHPLDSAEAAEKHCMLMSYYRQELDRQSQNRYEQAKDEDYYDSIQWTEGEAQELRDRGQVPIVYNVIATSVDWVLGSEKRGRSDFKILPRGKEDAKPAEGKTKYMKYLSDVNRTPFHRSRAFEDAVKVGIGWLEESMQDEDDGEPIYCRYESWRNMIWDSASTELDGSDMRYVFRSKWVDEDVALAIAPKDRRDIIAASVNDSTLYGSLEMHDGDEAMDFAEMEMENGNGITGGIVAHKRRRVRLIEAWYRVPEEVKRIRGSASPYNGQIFDENDPRHTEGLAQGQFIVVTKTMMRVRVALMTTKGLLYDGPSPFRHNRFKFIPIWGHRRGKDGMPYGIIRRVRDIQDDINKRMSKAQYILNTNKIIMEEGALPDDMTADDLAEEAARPDAVIVKRKGYQLELNVDRELSQWQLELASRNIAMVQQAGGVTDELLGRTTNAVSGVAVERRQEQGSLATAKYFDNLRLAEQLRGEIELSLVEQFATEEKQFRITNQRGTPEFVTVNDGLPENDIARSKADFVISEAEWRATMRQAAVDQLTEMLVKMPPQVGLIVLDLLVDNMDIPNREEIVKRIRAVNGQRDPDATELTPEEMAQQQAAAQQAELAQQDAILTLAEKQAKIMKLGAEANRIARQAVNESMNAANTAMNAATQVLQMPTIAKVADNLLGEAGWDAAHFAAQGLPAQQPAEPPPMPEEQPMPVDQPPMPQEQPVDTMMQPQ